MPSNQVVYEKVRDADLFWTNLQLLDCDLPFYTFRYSGLFFPLQISKQFLSFCVFSDNPRSCKSLRLWRDLIFAKLFLFLVTLSLCASVLMPYTLKGSTYLHINVYIFCFSYLFPPKNWVLSNVICDYDFRWSGLFSFTRSYNQKLRVSLNKWRMSHRLYH